MKIGVISDTHIPYKAPALPDVVLQHFNDADHIIHAGDIADLGVIRKLEELAPVTAVAGNIDPPELRELLGEKKLITLGGFTIGIIHGHGDKGKTIDRAAGAFGSDSVDYIIFGHSHIPFCGYRGSTLLFNPGSPTDKRINKYFSFGMLEVSETVSPLIVYFNASGDVVNDLNL